MVLAAACWGFATVMSKGGLAYIPPLTLLVVQLTASIASLWIVISVGRVRIHLDRRILWPALFGLLEPGLDHTLSLIGLTWTTWLGAILILFSVGSIFRMQRGETDLLSAYT
ncbi:MAG: EamA family transporter [Candidatus Bathyarchaeia archaeon]